MLQSCRVISSGAIEVTQITVAHLYLQLATAKYTHQVGHTRMLSLIILFEYVFKSTSNFTRSAWFLSKTSSAHLVSRAVDSAALERRGSPDWS